MIRRNVMKLADYLDVIGFPVIKMLKIKNDYPEEKSVIIIFVIGFVKETV